MAYLGRKGQTAPLTSGDIPDGIIVAADLAPNSVDSSELVDGSIDASHLASNIAISTTGAITTTGAFTSVGIDDNASGATAITIDSSENVGIGATPTSISNTKMLEVSNTGSSGIATIAITGNSGEYSNLYFGDEGDIDIGNISYYHGNNQMYFRTNTATQMVIAADGKVGIGTTAPTSLLHVKGDPSDSTIFQVIEGTNKKVSITGGASYGLQIYGDNGGAITFCNRSGDGQHFLFYKDGNSGGGNITQTGASVAYNTSSDYRMKENIVSLDNALDRLNQLKPSRFNFIGEEETRDGFIAHEVSDIVPEAVAGAKDATEERIEIVLNSDGTVCRESVSEEDWTAGKDSGEYASNTTWEATKNLPSYQSLDPAKLVPLLVGAVKELSAKVTALENA